MCGCDCCNSSNPACFDPSKVDSWASCKALSCGCDCGGCLSRVIDGAFDEGQRLGKQMGMDAAREAVAALPPSPLPERWGVRTAMNFRGDVLAAIDTLRKEMS